MNNDKKALIVHYLTEFVLLSIGFAIFIVILYLNEFHFSFSIISIWVFLYNGVLFTFWLWKNDAKLWEKSIACVYFAIIEIIIASSFSSFSIES